MGLHRHDNKQGVRLPALPAAGQVEQRQRQQGMTPRTSPGGIRLQLTWDSARCQSVAWKTFHLASPTTLNDPGRQLIKQEVICMDRVLPHPNVVDLLGVVKVSKREVRLVMEAAIVYQDNLMEMIAAAPEGRLGTDSARFYFGQLLKTIKHCHSKGVCHRDIKPANLLVDLRTGKMKLSGFGRAGLWDAVVGDANDLSYAPNGTALKDSAPEVVEGSKYDGKAADMWSCAVVLFTMLAGFSPLKIDAAETRDACGYSDYFQAAPWISPSARSLLEKMMDLDPKKRYTMDEVSSHPWLTRPRGDSSDDMNKNSKVGSDSGGELLNNRSSSSRSGNSTNSSSCIDGVQDPSR